MPQLIVLRHAKSDWDTAVSDHDRPLAKRGVGAARAIGVALARSRQIPDLVISSTAIRAWTTAELAQEAGDWPCEITTTESLYGASVGDALQVAAQAPQEVERLMLVGHEPTWSSLVAHLTGAYVHMKTATAAGIDLGLSDWSDIAQSRGAVSFVLPPRLFTDGDWDLDWDLD